MHGQIGVMGVLVGLILLVAVALPVTCQLITSTNAAGQITGTPQLI